MLGSIQLYETMIALDATKMSTEADATKTQIHATFERYGAEILVARPWDENGKLAYPINKQKKAYFYIVYYKMLSTNQAELERDFRINESVVRQLTSHIDPKWADTMMDIARNETGSRFAIKGMVDDSAPTGEGIISNDPMARGELQPDGSPRGPRGPRREFADKPE